MLLGGSEGRLGYKRNSRRKENDTKNTLSEIFTDRIKYYSYVKILFSFHK